MDRDKWWQCLEGMVFSGQVTGFIRAAYEGLSGEVKVGEVHAFSESFGMACMWFTTKLCSLALAVLLIH